MHPSKRTFWFEYEPGGVRVVAFIVELLYIAVCYFVLCLAVHGLGVHLNLWPYFPLYVVGFNVISLLRVRHRDKSGPSAP